MTALKAKFYIRWKQIKADNGDQRQVIAFDRTCKAHSNVLYVCNMNCFNIYVDLYDF